MMHHDIYTFEIFKIPEYVQLNMQFLMHCGTSIIIKDSNPILEE